MRVTLKFPCRVTLPDGSSTTAIEIDMPMSFGDPLVIAGPGLDEDYTPAEQASILAFAQEAAEIEAIKRSVKFEFR